MELAERHLGIGQVLGDALDEGGRHVDGDGLDGVRGAACEARSSASAAMVT